MTSLLFRVAGEALRSGEIVAVGIILDEAYEFAQDDRKHGMKRGKTRRIKRMWGPGIDVEDEERLEVCGHPMHSQECPECTDTVVVQEPQVMEDQYEQF